MNQRRIPPPPEIPDPIVFSVHRNGVTRTVQVPKAHAQRVVPQFPVLTFELLHGARITFRALP